MATSHTTTATSILQRHTMLIWLTLCCSLWVATDAFASTSTSSEVKMTAFVGQRLPRSFSRSHPSKQQQERRMRMDVEEPYHKEGGASPRILKGYNVRLNSHKTLLQIPKPQTTTMTLPIVAETMNIGVSNKITTTADTSRANKNVKAEEEIEQALQQHGLPWKTSIDPTYPSHPTKGLFYTPFFEYQLQFMKQELTNLRVLPTMSQKGDDLSYIEVNNHSKHGNINSQATRMATLTFSSDEYRKIRMTVYDAGNRTQVFTSLWYPDPKYPDLPVLGIDLLQFHGGTRHLCVVDFQPIHNEKSKNSNNHHYEQEWLQPIRDQYPSLQGQMTKRFYDENEFFSQQLLYGRFETAPAPEGPPTWEHHPVYTDLFPAFQQYLQAHVDMVKSTPPNQRAIPRTLQGQAAYDTYSADRDPAHAMFAKVFGPEFANAYVYDVLFSYSQGQERN